MTTNYKCEHCDQATEIEVDFGMPVRRGDEGAKGRSINPEFCDHVGCGRAFNEDKVFEQASEEAIDAHHERVEAGE